MEKFNPVIFLDLQNGKEGCVFHLEVSEFLRVRNKPLSKIHLRVRL